MISENLSAWLPESGKILWVLEEAGTLPRELISQHASRSHVLCNRLDHYHRYRELCETTLSDFELDAGEFDTLVFYVSKERLISNYIIAASAHWLKDTGSLILLGRKNEGIKNYFDKLSPKRKLKKHGDLYIGEARKPEASADALEAYRQGHNLQEGSLNLVSKPGIFSWKKIDQGSAFLIDTLRAHNIHFNGQSVLDLGCAYGYLALQAAELGASRVVATDNNVTAIDICKRNLARNQIDGEVLLDDCGQSIKEQFDIVLCNPPFHRGKNTEAGLTEKFIRAAANLLKDGAEAWFVTNVFIPVETISQANFAKAEVVERNSAFKVLRLRKSAKTD